MVRSVSGSPGRRAAGGGHMINRGIVEAVLHLQMDRDLGSLHRECQLTWVSPANLDAAGGPQPANDLFLDSARHGILTEKRALQLTQERCRYELKW